MFDDLRPYSEAFTVLLNIKDSLQPKRLQWLLGYPQPEITCPSNNMENFGIFGLNNLDDSFVVYRSTLNIENSFSILDLMVHNINRVESVCLLCLKQLLLLSFLNEHVYEYIVDLPGYCYLYARFTDWFGGFLEKYQMDLNRNYGGDLRKKELYLEAVKFHDIFKKKLEENQEINEEIKEITEENQEFEKKISEENKGINEENGKIEKKEAILKGFRDIPLYIIGQTVSEITTELKKTHDFRLFMREISAFTLISKPTGKSNLAFPRSIAREAYLFQNSVDSNSVFSCFIHSKYSFTENYEKKNKKLTNFYQFFKSKLGLNFEKTEEKPEEKGENREEKEEKREEKEEKCEENGEKPEESDVIEEKTTVEMAELSGKVRIFDCIRKFSFKNKSNHHILLTFLIKPKKAPFINIRPLKDPILTIFRPYASLDVFFLMKKDFSKEWDDYEVIYRVFNLFLSENSIKETKIYENYIENRDLECDYLVITDENGEKSKEIETRVLNFKQKNCDKKNIEYDQEFELFPEEAEFGGNCDGFLMNHHRINH